MDCLLISKTILAVRRTRRYRRTVPVACALLALCGGFSAAKGQAIFTGYTGTMTRVAGLAGLVNPGTLECLNGEPTGVPWYAGIPCSPADSRVRIRGVVMKYRTQGSEPRTTGWLYLTVNANLDHWPGAGPMWGTARLEVDQGGIWEIVWTGERQMPGETARAVGHGIGGIVEGLKYEQQTSLVPGSNPPTYTVTGTILQPAGK